MSPLRSIRLRILLAFVLSLCAFGGALGYALVQLGAIGRRLEVLDSGYLPLARVSAELDAVARQLDREHDRMTREEVRVGGGHRTAVSFSDGALSEATREGLEVASSAMLQARDLEDRRALENLVLILEEIEQQHQGYRLSFRSWLDSAGGRSPGTHLAELDARRAGLIVAVDQFAQVVEGRIQIVSGRTRQAQVRAEAISGALAVVATLLAGAMAGLALLTLRPIGRLTEEAQRLAAGEYAGRIEVSGPDELGQLAREFNAMASAVAERDRRLKERAEALDQLSLRLRKVLDSIHAGIVVVEGGHAVMANPAAASLWQVQEGAALPPQLSGLGPGREEGRAIGDRRFDVQVVPFGEGGALILGEDVTERQRVRERLARTERLALVGQMLAQITHEVRNPLNAISLNAELLSEELENPDHRGMMATITGEIYRLEGLTSRYLELSRDRRPELSPCQPQRLVAEVMSVEEEVLRRASVRARMVTTQTAEIEVDVEAVRRALRNLLRNAVEAGARQITFRLDDHPHQLVISVEDDGPGLDSESIQRAFEPFYTTKAKGTGLGLAISRQELEESGAALQVRSAPGQGAVFSILLPRAPAG
jgi:signal transduction histidine kinase